MARTLPQVDARAELLSDAAERHLTAGLAHVNLGYFLTEHWLGAFAVYSLRQHAHQP